MIIHEKMEANIVHHCNNRCASCNHFSPFAPPYLMSPEALRIDLELLKSILHVGFFCLQGGEPLLHPYIEDMMEVAAQSGIADRCGILTNGKLLRRQPESFWQRCRWHNFELRCTVYPNLDQKDLDDAKAKAAKYHVDFRPSPVQTSFLKMLKPNNGHVFKNCPWKVCWTVHEGWFYLCPIAPFLAPQVLNIKPEVDGIAIDEHLTEEDLRAYVYREKPLKSCYSCAGCTGGSVEWHQPGNLEDWMKVSTV